MTKPEGISDEAWEKAEQVAKEATRDAMRDPLMPYYITVAPHIARAIQSSVEAERAACADIALNAGAKHYAETHPGHQRVPVELEVFIANKIRSRKGA